MDQPQIIEDNPQPFIVKVKLLSNEVHQFTVNKDMKIADFKVHISPTVNVPVDRMRIVFAGKQLLDQKPLSQYVSQSGMTVHLIARIAPPPQPSANNTGQSQQSNIGQTQNNSQSQGQGQGIQGQQSGQSGQAPPNPFGDIMGMVNSLFGGQQTGNMPPPQITMSFGTLNNPINLLNGLGVRIPQPQPQPQPPQPTQTSPQNSSQVPTEVPSTSSSAPRRISYSQLSNLNQLINNLNIPLDNVTLQNENLTPEEVFRYLRRLHHQSTRSMLQLNRLLNLVEGNNQQNISILDGFVPVLRGLNEANNVAINCLSELQTSRAQRQPSQVNRPAQENIQNQHQHQQVPQQPTQPVVRIGISVSDQNGTQAQTITQSQGPQIPQPPLQTQSQPQQQSIPQMQMPMNPLQFLGGLDMSSLMGGLQSVGGIGGLFGMSLKQMMSQNGQQPNGVFIDIFGGMTGQNMMQMFTTKDIRFLNQKQSQIRQKLNKRIRQSSLQQVIDDITEQASAILVPNRPYPLIKNYQTCRQVCKKRLRVHVQKLVQISISQNNSEYYLKVSEIGKKALSETISTITQNSHNNNEAGAFQILKIQTLAVLDPILPGIAGMFYGLMQRDLVRIYQEYKAEEQRKKSQSKEEEKSEQKLIEMIKQIGSKHSEQLANIQHSKHYYP